MKMWMIIFAAALIVVGLIMVVAVLGVNQWDWNCLSTREFETNSHNITQPFYDISVNTDTADITFLPSEDDTCRVVCYEAEKQKHSVRVQNGTLLIDIEDNRAWYDYIGISIDSTKISVYLPETVYGSLSVKGSAGGIKITDSFSFCHMDLSMSTGKILLEHFSAQSIDAKVSTGEVTIRSVACDETLSLRVTTGDTVLKEVSCHSLISDGSTGDITLSKVIAFDRFKIERTTGDVYLQSSDASEIAITTTTGDVKGTLQTQKIFYAQTSTGRVEVPHCLTGGRCEIKTTTGNISITVE